MRSLRDQEVACSTSDRHDVNPVSREQCHLIHLTILIGGSLGPIYPVCAQKWHKALISSFVSTSVADIGLLASPLPTTIGLPAVVTDILDTCYATLVCVSRWEAMS